MVLYLVLIAVAVLFILSLSPIYLVKVCSGKDNQPLIALTFDDGYSCWISEIMPVLKYYNLPASGYITNPDYREDFTWAEVQQLYDAGWEIGWHTTKHISVDKVGWSELTSDFINCKALFKSHGLPPPVTFAYPHGRHDFRSVKVASEYFLASRTTHHGVNSPHDVHKNPAHLKRYNLERELAFLKKTIKKYYQQNMLIVFSCHTVGQIAEWQTKTDMTVEDFKELVKFLNQEKQNGHIDVVTLSEGINRIQHREVSYAWRFKIDSPFNAWCRFWIVPIPERYYTLYHRIIQDFVGQHYPRIANWLDRF